jgi:hypothetical protein
MFSNLGVFFEKSTDIFFKIAATVANNPTNFDFDDFFTPPCMGW